MRSGYVQQAACVVFFVGLYYFLVETNILPDPPFAKPLDIVSFMRSGGLIALLGIDLSSTVLWTIVSWVLGSVAGSVLGLILVLVKPVKSLVKVFDFLRSIPSLMWVPYSFFLVGLGYKTVLLVSCFSIFLFTSSQIAYSQLSFNKRRSARLAKLGCNLYQRIIYCGVYEMLLIAVPIYKVSVNIALVVVIISEMLSGTSCGLGARLLDYQMSYNTPGMLVVLILSGVLGMSLNYVSTLFENKVLYWKSSQ